MVHSREVADLTVDVTPESHRLAAGVCTIRDERAPAHRRIVEVMPAAEPRYTVAQVTEESVQGWIAFCDRHSIDRAVLCEVLGLTLGAMTAPPPPWLERIVKQAQELKNQRRRRG